jgi:DNA-binding transcriptional LysR family regulator
MVARDIAAGRLRPCIVGYEAFPPLYRAPIYAVHRRGEIPAKVSVFVAHLKSALNLSAPLSRKSGK